MLHVSDVRDALYCFRIYAACTYCLSGYGRQDDRACLRRGRCLPCRQVWERRRGNGGWHPLEHAYYARVPIRRSARDCMSRHLLAYPVIGLLFADEQCERPSICKAGEDVGDDTPHIRRLAVLRFLFEFGREEVPQVYKPLSHARFDREIVEV